MKTILLTLSCVLLFATMACAQKKYKSSFERDSVGYYKVQARFSAILEKIKNTNCCLEDSSVSHTYQLFYQRVDTFMTTHVPGYNLDTMQTRQTVFYCEKISYMLEKAYKKGWKIDSQKYFRKVGFFTSEHQFFIHNMDEIIYAIEQKEND